MQLTHYLHSSKITTDYCSHHMCIRQDEGNDVKKFFGIFELLRNYQNYSTEKIVKLAF